MDFIQHPTCTRVLGAPAGVPIEECRALPIADVVINGGPGVASFWRPTPEELASLNAGKPVVLFIAGRTHAPLYLAVEA